MSRPPRLCPNGIPQHVIQRGNNRQACFNSDEDLAAYAYWLEKYARKYSVSIHAWVFMTNYVHLLVTPFTEQGVSKMMQSLGRNYVRYYNRSYKRSGTLWEGRFKSCLVEDNNYLLYCYRYIELNPVRAGMVNAPEDYAWSSHRTNAIGLTSKLIAPHPVYLELGATDEERYSNYSELFRHEIDQALVKDIRASLNQGSVFGSERFKDEIEENLNRRVRQLKPGPKARTPREFLL